jgi:hypothetical protein
MVIDCVGFFLLPTKETPMMNVKKAFKEEGMR